MQKALYFRNKGELVAGTLHLPDNRRRCPGVLMCHGFTGQKSESHFYLVALSRRLAEAGIASLRFDFRGSGESEGEFEDMTPLEEVSDARAALRQLAGIARVDERRLGIFGWSLGGLVATLTAAKEKSIKSAVLWAAVARPEKVFAANRAKGALNELKKHGRTDIGGLYLGRRFWDTICTIDPPAELAKSKAPALLVHGTADTTVPPVNSKDLLRAGTTRGVRTELFTVKGADHLFSSMACKEQAIGRTVAWFEETLL